MNVFDLIVGVTGDALLVAIAAVMLHRRLWREYPFFFFYIVFNAVTTLYLLLIQANYKLFFFSYWVVELISAVNGLLALHEAFHDVFRAFYLFWWFRLIFPTAVGVISAIALWRAVLRPLPRVPMLMTVSFAFDNAVAWVKAGVFVIFLLLVVVLRVRWRRYPYDVALGFALSSVGIMVSYAVFTAFGTRFILIARNAPPLAYILAATIWLWTFAARFEPEPRALRQHDLTPEQLRLQVKEYVATMKTVVGGARADDD